MRIDGLHLLLTYECNLHCDHCFVFGGPGQAGTMTLDGLRTVLDQARDCPAVEWIYFEGGEPFLYYGLLSQGVEWAAAAGYKVGIVSNAFWATSPADAELCLRPFVGKVHDLSISSDDFHWSEKLRRNTRHALEAGERLGIPAETISICQPEQQAGASHGQIPPGESAVVFRGRAAEKLAGRVPGRDWREFTACPHEDLRDPGRVHIDPLGHVHVCQGLLMGNLFETPLAELFRRYDPDAHPVVGPLLRGGPAELVRVYDLADRQPCADACHLCFRSRRVLRERMPSVLGPGQVYLDGSDGC